ncbi:MAG: hypothetical protein ACOZNI_01110 [Myxococcota bacterium]
MNVLSRPLALLGLPLLALACTPGPMGAPLGSTVEIHGEGLGVVDLSTMYTQDGVGLLKSFYAIVWGPEDTSSDQSSPLPGVQVEILSTWIGAYVVAEGAVQEVDDFSDRCEEIDNADAECAVWYSVNGERYVEFAGEYQNVDEFRPTYMAGVTDARGVMPFYLFIDALAFDDNDEPVDFQLYGTIGVAEDVFDLEWAQ